MTFINYYQRLNPEIKKYFKIISPVFPEFLIPFIESNTLMRLKDVSYFCGAEYGSKDVYNFKYSVSRLDHSISTALHVWAHSFDEEATLAALFHDATTPALSHVIDYLNEDFLDQESTELDLYSYVRDNDPELFEYFEKVGVDLRKIANFKNYSLVDLPRPALCADRLDCIFLASLAWTRCTTIDEVSRMYKDVVVLKNENNQDEFAFCDLLTADRAVELNDIINNLTKSNSDYESMLLLSAIIRRLLELKALEYEDLFIMTDREVMSLIEYYIYDKKIGELYIKFKTLKEDLNLTTKSVKDRKLDPIVIGKRYTKY